MKDNLNPSINKKSPLNFKLIKQIKYDLKLDSVQSWARRLRCQYWKSQMISGSSCTRFEPQLTLIRANTPWVINMSNIVVLCFLAVGTQTYNLQSATTIWNQGQENQLQTERKNQLTSIPSFPSSLVSSCWLWKEPESSSGGWLCWLGLGN